jgi:NAD(P)-dependent dehydrogenase (short-subunit alcohol dehydrogenase family)
LQLRGTFSPMSEWCVAGKTCVVTGANVGIGKETAIGLARKGAHVLMVCRSRERGEAALGEVRAAARSDRVELLLCDMAAFASMRELSEAIHERFESLHVLVNNAGAMFARRELTVDGIEHTFQVNHLGYFVVTHLLLDLLRASAPARIVNVASRAHRRARFEFDNLQGEREYGDLSAYSRSKLYNIAFTYELARRLQGSGVTANCLHPGVVASNFGLSAGPAFRALVRVGRPFLLSPERGAQTSIYVASSPDLDGVSGKYFDRCRAVRTTKLSYDVAAHERLWRISADLTGLGRD